MASSTTFPRTMGALTLAYSIGVVISPKLLAKPCGLALVDGSVDDRTAAAVRGVSTRDAIISAAMLVAPAGSALKALTWTRAACDLSDAFAFSRTTSGSDRAKVIGVAAGWASLVALSSRSAG